MGPKEYEVRLIVTSVLSAEEVEQTIVNLLDGNGMSVGSYEVEEVEE